MKKKKPEAEFGFDFEDLNRGLSEAAGGLQPRSLARGCVKIRDESRKWIENLPTRRVFNVSEIYSYIRANFPDECSRSGLTTDGEEKWKKDSRWPLQDLKMKHMVAHVGPARSGHWRRT